MQDKNQHLQQIIVIEDSHSLEEKEVLQPKYKKLKGIEIPTIMGSIQPIRISLAIFPLPYLLEGEEEHVKAHK